MDNRSTLLQCALELFAARGYDAVGVQEVVEAAGVTKPTLYHYFGNKQGLLQALFDTHLSDFNHRVKEAAAYHGDLPGALQALARVFFDFARMHPTYYRMQLAMYFAPQQSEAYQLAAFWNDQQFQQVADLFSAAVSNHGNLRGRHHLYAATYIGMLNTCIGLYLNGNLELDEGLIHRVVQQFQYGIYS